MEKRMVLCLVVSFSFLFSTFVFSQTTELEKVRMQRRELEQQIQDLKSQLNKIFWLEDSLENEILMDVRFECVKELDLTVPEHYNHATYLSYFHAKYGSDFERIYDDNISDENYQRVSTKLFPGQKIKVKIFQLNQRVSANNCLAFLRKQGAILVGTQGLALFYELTRKDALPKGWFISLDKEENFPLGIPQEFRGKVHSSEKHRLTPLMDFGLSDQSFFSTFSGGFNGSYQAKVYYLLAFYKR